MDERIDEVAQVVFARKRLVEVHYLRATIAGCARIRVRRECVGLSRPGGAAPILHDQ